MMDETEKVNILVVDDLPEKLLVYRAILEELDENLVAALSGEEALKKVLQDNFAVILLDVNMPTMDGFETASLIRKRKRSEHTPIIFVTAFMDDVRPIQGYAHGAVDYIMAPVAPAILRAKVKVFVDLFRMNQQVKRQAEERVALAEERAKRAAVEEANRNLAFLAEASRILTSSLDLEAIIRGLARLSVSTLADFSAVCLADEFGGAGPTEYVRIDSFQGKSDEAGTPDMPLPESLRLAIDRVLATGAMQLLPNSEFPAVIGQGGKEPEAGNSGCPAGGFDLKSAVVVPLAARGKILGALALAFGPSGRSHRPADLSLIDDLACRAGIAIDNALLVRDIQDADRRKDEFLAMLAHELRNPLAPIRNAVHVLRLTGPMTPEVQWARDMIDRQLRQMKRLVDDLLDVSRITRGKIRLQLESLDLANAVTHAVETCRPLIESRKHQLHLSMPEAPVWVSADPDRLSQILSNLLNNAAKYTGEGGQIWLSVERDGDEVVFRVRDSGMGIQREMLRRVFDLFTQLDQSVDRSQGGLGIGLTLVRQLVEMHKGSVQALSPGVGQGSEFVVRLPILCDSPRRETTDSSVVLPRATVFHRVLVVDDNEDGAATLAELVRLHGHEVRTAHDGAAALALAEEFRPEVILVDIGLPDMDGYEVARRLRVLANGNRIVLAAVTGYGREEDRRRAREAGFDYHLTKPIDPEELPQVLNARETSSSLASTVF